eukprot:3610570-Heterocapsa_arctica.AAC.1
MSAAEPFSGLASRNLDAPVGLRHSRATDPATKARRIGRPQKRQQILPDPEPTFDLQGNCVHRYTQGAVRRLLRSGTAMAQFLSSC